MDEHEMFNKYIDYLEDMDNPFISFNKFKLMFYPSYLSRELNITVRERKFQQEILAREGACYTSIYS